MRLITLLVLCLPLLTTGCFVGDGVAHVVKLASRSGDKSDQPNQTVSAHPAPVPSAPAAAAPVDRDPAPMPATAPSSAIQSEDLAPPRR